MGILESFTNRIRLETEKIAKRRNEVDDLINKAFNLNSPGDFLRSNNVTSEELEDAYKRAKLNTNEYIQTGYVYPELMAARSNNEIFAYSDKNGRLHSILNTLAGVLSPADPVGSFVVGSEVLGPIFNLIGKGALWGAGMAGNNWARGKIISGTMNKAIDKGVKPSGIIPARHEPHINLNILSSDMSFWIPGFVKKRTSDISSGEMEYINAFLSGTKPMYSTVSKGYGSDSFLNVENLLKGHKYIELERPSATGGMLTLRYYINEDKLKQTIAAYKDLYKDRLGLRTDNVDDIYNHLINNPRVLDLSVRPGTPGILDIIGLSLGYGIKDAIMFKLGANGLFKGSIIPSHFAGSLKTYGYDKLVPGVYNILKKNIERGTLVGKHAEHNGSHIGFGYSPKTFIDDYGRKVVATPWKGTDLQLASYIPEYQKKILSHYWSPLKKLQVMQSMGWGEKEYSEFLNELLRSLGTVAKGEVKGPEDGFTIIAQHKGLAIGTGSEMKGHHIMTFNRERIPNKLTAIEAILHELGGHGKTMSIDPSKSTNISEAFPRITLLMLKNEEIANSTLLLNQRGKFWSLFPTADQLEIFLYNLEKKRGTRISSEGTQNLFNQRKYYLYNTNILEKMTRGYVGLLMEKLGYNKTMNLELLKRYFTPESVEKFKKAVLNYSVPVTIGGYSLNKYK